MNAYSFSVELQETQGVCVAGYKTDEFPAFFSETSGCKVTFFKITDLAEDLRYCNTLSQNFYDSVFNYAMKYYGIISIFFILYCLSKLSKI